MTAVNRVSCSTLSRQKSLSLLWGGQVYIDQRIVPIAAPRPIGLQIDPVCTFQIRSPDFFPGVYRTAKLPAG